MTLVLPLSLLQKPNPKRVSNIPDDCDTTNFLPKLKRLNFFPFSYAGKYTALLAVLIVGSFVIPMAQYFWYVKDDDSSDRFFAESKAPPKAAAKAEPPKKKGWFN